MRLYLDNCCFNRPYDTQSNLKIRFETEAKHYIQQKIRDCKHIMITSYMLEYENSQNIDEMKRKAIAEFQEIYTSGYIPIERRETLLEKIHEIMDYNISYKDATHLACAIYAKCDCLITTDIRFQKRYKGDEIRILNPIEFVQLDEED